MRNAAARLRACWHVLRGRQVVYGARLGACDWRPCQCCELVFVGCALALGFTVGGVPAAELAGRGGDVRLRPGQLRRR